MWSGRRGLPRLRLLATRGFALADELLLSVWREAAREIAARAIRIATESNYRRAFAQLVQIREILDDLDTNSRRYVETLIEKVYREADARAIRLLASQGKQDLVTAFSLVNERAVRYIVEGTSGELGGAVEGLRQRADTFFRQTRLEATLNRTIQEKLAEQTAQGLARPTITRALSAELRQTFEDGVVEIRSVTGKLFHYDVDYYAGLVAQNGRAAAVTAATIQRTAINGVDLVIVSNNFSIVQDFCDAYRGRVYSISGTHPLAPPLIALPNGGTPFHINCRHGLQGYVEEFYSEQDLMIRAQTDPRFLYVDGREAQRRWERLGPMEQAQLRHAPDKAREIVAAA